MDYIFSKKIKNVKEDVNGYICIVCGDTCISLCMYYCGDMCTGSCTHLCSNSCAQSCYSSDITTPGK